MAELQDCRVERVAVYDVYYDDEMAEEVHGFYEQPVALDMSGEPDHPNEFAWSAIARRYGVPVKNVVMGDENGSAFFHTLTGDDAARLYEVLKTQPLWGLTCAPYWVNGSGDAEADMREAVCQLLDVSERAGVRPTGTLLNADAKLVAHVTDGVPDDFARFEDAPESSYSAAYPHGWATDRYVVIVDPT